MHGGGRGLSSHSFALATASSLRRGFWLDRAAGWDDAAVSGAHRCEGGQVVSREAGRRVLTALEVSFPQSARKEKYVDSHLVRVALTKQWSEDDADAKLEEISEGGISGRILPPSSLCDRQQSGFISGLQ